MDVVEAIAVLGKHCLHDRKKVIRDSFTAIEARIMELLSENIKLRADNADLRERLEDLLRPVDFSVAKATCDKKLLEER